MEAPIQSSSVDGQAFCGSRGSTSAAGAEGTSSVGGVAPPPSSLPVLAPPALGVRDIPPSSPGLTVQSGTVTNVSSLLVETESITAVPSLATAPVPHTVEINPFGLSSPLPPHSDTLLTPLTSSSASTLGCNVTGTGSVTATPTAYTTAVMTTATTTTSMTPVHLTGQLLGKRVRRQSSKYEDYDQQTLSVKSSPTSLTEAEQPAAKTERMTTSNQLQFLLKATRALWRHHYAWPFHKPVDPVTLNLPDYFQIVKRPMDMGVIKKNLENCVYSCSMECIQDYRQMFNNCYLYNKPTDDVVMMCHEVEKALDRKLPDMPAQVSALAQSLHHWCRVV
jgi:hypothetical protein